MSPAISCSSSSGRRWEFALPRILFNSSCDAFMFFLFKLMSNGQGYQQIETFPNIAIPGLSKIPLIGEAFFNCDFLTYLIYILLITFSFKYNKKHLTFSC